MNKEKFWTFAIIFSLSFAFILFTTGLEKQFTLNEWCKSKGYEGYVNSQPYPYCWKKELEDDGVSYKIVNRDFIVSRGNAKWTDKA